MGGYAMPEFLKLMGNEMDRGVRRHAQLGPPSRQSQPPGDRAPVVY